MDNFLGIWKYLKRILSSNWWMILMFLAETPLHAFCESKPEVSLAEIQDLWSTLTPKPTPLYKCHGWYGGTKMGFPSPPDCTLPDAHVSNKMVSVTLFLPDVNRQTVTGYECYSVKKTEWISIGFFNTRKQGSRVEYFDISINACWNMALNRKSPTDEEMNSQGGKVVGTSNVLVIETSWMRNVTESVTNYYFREVMVSVYDLDESVITTSDTKQPCMFNDTYCPTTFGILVWKPTDFKTCRLTEVDTSSCLFSVGESSSRLTCPELQLALHDIKETKMCDLTFGTSAQGYFVLQTDIGELSETISLSHHATDIVSSPHGRVKRSTAKPNPMDIFNNGKYSYLYDSLKKSVEHAFRVVHQDICNTNYLLWTFLTSVAQIGYPTLLVQVLYKDKSLRASFSGDAISIWQCAEIYTYKFLEREKCTIDWPVVYLDSNHKQQMGFVTPFSHAVVDRTVEMPEPCAEFYFNAKDYTLQLTSAGPKPVNLPHLPQPTLRSKNITFPDIAFKSMSGFDVTGYTDYTHTMTMIHEQNERNKLVQDIREGNIKIKESSVGIVDVACGVGTGIITFVGSFWGSVFSSFSWFKTIVIVAILICICFGLCALSGPMVFLNTTRRIFKILVGIVLFPVKLIFNNVNRRNTIHVYDFPVPNERTPHVALDLPNGQCCQRNVMPSAPLAPLLPPRK